MPRLWWARRRKYMNSELQYWLGFSQITKIGPVRFTKLIKHFDSLEQAWSASAYDIERAGIPHNISEEIVLRRSQVDLDALIGELVKNRVRAVTILDDDYPELLKNIPTAPPLLYFKGNLKKEKHIISIVGTRKMSDYGKSVVDKLIQDIAQAGVTVVSGLAFGIDAQVHQSCIEHNCRTMAVVASGLDDQSMYPSRNRYIAQEIIKNNGAIFSENPLYTIPQKHDFPQRNRIIAGMSQLTIVVEAAERSGSLITAIAALDFNRDVGAVPGNIYSPTSVGCHAIIKKGAYPITDAEDILSLLNIDNNKNAKTIPLTPEENNIIKHISHEPVDIDIIAKTANLPVQQVLGIITRLEIKGCIERSSGNKFFKNK